MARYTGPKRKLERRENATLFGNENWKKRPTPPGQHGASRSRPSAYAIQFREKQKVKRMYGVLEKQFVNLYKKAVKFKGNTGLRILQLLELRLDNVIYRLGFAKTRNQARQIVTHGHVTINSKKVNIPSYQCKAGEVIGIKVKSLNSEMIKIIKVETKANKTPKWITQMSDGGEIVEEPKRDDIDRSINEQQIVEFYSR